MPTLAEQFAGKGSTTQLGQALEAAAIAWVAARSPEAKGRVERLWGTAQDRLRVELRLAGASTLEEANTLLPVWVERHNARFAVAAAEPEPAWRPLPGGLEPEELFCFRHRRKVARDGTFTLAGESLMLAQGRVEPHRLGRRLVISERLDGSRWVEIDGTFQLVVPAPERPARLRRQAGDPGPKASVARVPHRPAPDHPGVAILRSSTGDGLAGRQSVRVTGRRQARVSEAPQASARRSGAAGPVVARQLHGRVDLTGREQNDRPWAGAPGRGHDRGVGGSCGVVRQVDRHIEVAATEAEVERFHRPAERADELGDRGDPATAAFAQDALGALFGVAPSDQVWACMPPAAGRPMRGTGPSSPPESSSSGLDLECLSTADGLVEVSVRH